MQHDTLLNRSIKLNEHYFITSLMGLPRAMPSPVRKSPVDEKHPDNSEIHVNSITITAY